MWVVELIIQLIFKECLFSPFAINLFCKILQNWKKSNCCGVCFYAAGFRAATVVWRDFAVNLAKFFSVLGDFQRWACCLLWCLMILHSFEVWLKYYQFKIHEILATHCLYLWQSWGLPSFDTCKTSHLFWKIISEFMN